MRKVLKILFGIAAVLLAFLVVMLLWNELMPAIFGLPYITYLQAAGLMILLKLLLGGHGRWGHGHWKNHRMKEKWSHMSPEDRKKFCEGRHFNINISTEKDEEAKI
jgi:hypothetical protein